MRVVPYSQNDTPTCAEYSLVLRPDLDTWSRYDSRADFILLQQLDLANTFTVSGELSD